MIHWIIRQVPGNLRWRAACGVTSQDPATTGTFNAEAVTCLACLDWLTK